MANGVSEQFYDGPNHQPTNDWKETYYTFPFLPVTSNNVSNPMYAVHIQLHYSFGISPLLRIESGIGYLLSGFINSIGASAPGYSYQVFEKEYFYVGCITLPLYVKFTKPTPHGAFTCSIGPDFTLPVHSFYQENLYNIPTTVTHHGHDRYSTSQTAQASSMGGYLKMGYEKQLKNGLSVNVGPAVDFFGLVQFHTAPIPPVTDGYYPYAFYAALDVAVCFGLKKKTK